MKHFKILMVFFLFPVAALAAESHTTQLSEELIELRSEVEALNSQVQAQKSDYENRLRSLTMRKGDLETEIQREQVRKRQLAQKIKKIKQHIGSNSAGEEALKEIVLASIEELKISVSGSLPFKKEKRLQELGELEEKVQKDVLKPQKAVARLWSFIEDEFRLTRENGLFRQAVVVEGEEKLATVARLGMAMMYFKTNDEQYGVVKPLGDQWTFSYVHEDAAQDQLENLFNSLKKQIRVGYFEIPSALGRPEGVQ